MGAKILSKTQRSATSEARILPAPNPIKNLEMDDRFKTHH